jgi:hypothetical protein
MTKIIVIILKSRISTIIKIRLCGNSGHYTMLNCINCSKGGLGFVMAQMTNTLFVEFLKR